MQVNKSLYLVRGLPGAGKTTFAKELGNSIGAFTFEADHYFEDDEGNYHWDASKVHLAHEWCQHKARHIMSLMHSPLVISNTFTTEKEMQPYLDMAKQFGYKITTLIIENRHGNESVHNVPSSTMDKMRNRFSVKL